MPLHNLSWGVNQPAAKLGDLSQLVLHLINVDAGRRIVICGNDRRVPVEWLRRWSGMAALNGVEFYFLGQSGGLEILYPQQVGIPIAPTSRSSGTCE